MKLAVMQPYFFPYVGYWQLIKNVDRFVIYDDVNYIKGGWVNRNRILINGEPSYITVPLHRASPYRRICDTSLHLSVTWREKITRSIENTYRRAPYFKDIFPIVAGLIRNDSNNLSEYLVHQVEALAEIMGITTTIIPSSQRYENSELAGQTRVLDICRRNSATVYMNAQGGQSIYDATVFRRAGLDLQFIVMRPVPYRQRSAQFVPYLSIIDVLMEVGLEGVQRHLDSFDFIFSVPAHEYQS